MKHWWKHIATALMALIMLTGCIASKTETTIKADGSGTNAMKVGFGEEAKPLLSQAGGEDPFAEARSSVDQFPAEWDAKVEDWKEDLDGKNYEGVKISMKFNDIATLNAQLQQLMSSGSTSGDPASGFLSNLKVEDTGSTFVVTGNGQSQDLAEGSETSGIPGGDALKTAYIAWEITMPGKIQEFEPKEIATQNGNTVLFRFPADKTQTYNLRVVSAKSGGGGGGSLGLILAIVGGVVLLAGLAFVFLNRRKSAPAAAYAGGTGGAYDPNAGYGQQGGYTPPTDPNAGYGQQGGYTPPTDPNAGYGYTPPTDPNAGYGQQGGYTPPTDPNAGYGQPGGYTPPTDPNDPTRR